MNIIRKQRTFNSGFTIIELLVVVSVVGMMSSVVLGSVNVARAKAANAQANENFNSVRIAFANYSNEFGGPPRVSSTGLGGLRDEICLADYGGTCGASTCSNTCGVREFGEYYTPITDYLQTQMSTLPKNTTFRVGSNIMKSPTYMCNTQNTSICTSAFLKWYLQGDAVCAGGATKIYVAPSNFTNCTYAID